MCLAVPLYPTMNLRFVYFRGVTPSPEFSPRCRRVWTVQTRTKPFSAERRSETLVRCFSGPMRSVCTEPFDGRLAVDHRFRHGFSNHRNPHLSRAVSCSLEESDRSEQTRNGRIRYSKVDSLVAHTCLRLAERLTTARLCRGRSRCSDSAVASRSRQSYAVARFYA